MKFETKMRLKRLVYDTLAHPVLGRPTRKIAYLLMRGLTFGSFRIQRLHDTLPYVRSLDTKVRQTSIEVIARYYKHLGDIQQELDYRPKISVLIPVYKVQPHYFEDCLRSIEQQVYEDWEVCVVDDRSEDDRLTKIVADFSARHPGRVHAAIMEKNSHISHTSNRCLSMATGDYVALLDHDDLLMPNALAEMVRHINLHGRPEILFSDERTVDAKGEKLNAPYYKPGWSPYLHLSMNYTTHLSVYSRALVDKVGGFRPGYEGSQDHDLMLRCVEGASAPPVHVPFILYQWRAHEHSTALSISAKPYAATNGERVVTEALARRGRKATVTWEPHTFHYNVQFEVPQPEPLVSIVIPSKDHADLIRRCLASIVEKSTYKNYEIIISDNGSTDPAALELYESYRRKLGERFQAHVEPRPFNFARQINEGVARSRGAFLLLLNNDTEVITPGWLEELVSVCQWPEVGSVGCKLLFPNGSIQHAGILTSGRNIATHAGIRETAEDMFYQNTVKTRHEVIAVTGACAMFRREVFDAMGGLDQRFLPNGYGDVELGIKLTRAGYLNLYTPYATLIHYESPTRGRSIEHAEKFLLMRKYGQELLRDPYLNPNLRWGTLYKPDELFDELDLKASEMNFFLRTPKDQWVARSTEF
jgi:glycosyltransferase involved in cell wall biosynthesis